MSISKLNFKNDLGIIIKQYFKALENLSPSLNYYDQIKNKSDPKELCLEYLNLTNRLVEPKPREILISHYFYCPKRFRAILGKIEEKIKTGEDITPYLSKEVGWVDDKVGRKNRHRDRLLDAWGIHHIHLGDQVESNGFVKRSGPILFVRFKENSAYFIIIKRHGRRTKKSGKKSKRSHYPWNRQILIEIIHNNWSDSIQDYEANVEFERPSDDEIKQWRSVDINVPATSKNGTAYFGPGGGVASSGNNIQNVRICYHIFDYIDVVEKYLKDNISELIEFLRQHGKDVKPPIDFQLISFEFIELKLRLEVLEKNSQVYIVFEEGKQPQLSFETS